MDPHPLPIPLLSLHTHMHTHTHVYYFPISTSSTSAHRQNLQTGAYVYISFDLPVVGSSVDLSGVPQRPQPGAPRHGAASCKVACHFSAVMKMFL